MVNKKIYLTCLLGFSLLSAPVFAYENEYEAAAPCPVASPYTDAFGNTVSYADKFGAGVMNIINCVQEREEVKLVMQVNQYVDAKGRPYGFRNVGSMIRDYTVAAGINKKEIDFNVVVHGGGFPFVLDPDAVNAHADAPKNKFKGMVQDLIASGVNVYFCLNTAAAKNIKADQLIPGVQAVTGGLTAVADFQERGYSYIQP